MRLLFITVVFAGVSVVFCSCSSTRYKQAAGERAIMKIEQFRQQNSRLPNSLAEIGIDETEEGPVYYRKEDERRYIVWYGTTLGSSMVYDSAVGRWEAHD